MRNLFWAILATALLSMGEAPVATAQEDGEEDDSWRFYGSVSIGPTWPTIGLADYDTEWTDWRGTTSSSDVGFEVAGSLGLEMPWLRWDVAQLAYDWSSTVVTDRGSPGPQYWQQRTGHSSLLTLGTGIRIGPFGADYFICPYGSFGLGGGRLQIDGPVPYSDFARWGFEWNAGLGVEFRLMEEVGVGLRYRYRSISIDFVEAAFGEKHASLELQNLSLELVF